MVRVHTDLIPHVFLPCPQVGVFVSIVSTKIPFKGAGKEYIGDDVEEMVGAVKSAIQVGRMGRCGWIGAGCIGVRAGVQQGIRAVAPRARNSTCAPPRSPYRWTGA